MNSSDVSAAMNSPSFCRSCAGPKKRPRRQGASRTRCASSNIVHGGGSVSLSVGIAFYPDHAATVEDWLHHADLAMYQAKRQREPHCIYEPGDSPADFASLPIEVEDAYSREFLLCFQPIFDVESGSVVAAEALLRSLHPQDGVQSAYITMETARARRSIDIWTPGSCVARLLTPTNGARKASSAST